MKNRVVYSFVLLCVVMAVVVSSLRAQETQNQRIGSAAAPELLVPVDARGLAMGGSCIALAEGVSAIHWNPAGLGHLGTSAQAMFTSMAYIADIRLNYGAVGVSFGGFGVVGVSVRSFSFGDISLTTNDDPEGLMGRTFSPTFITVGLTYARAFTDAITVGGTVKAISETMARANGSAMAFDLGVQYRNVAGVPGLNLGVALKNYGTQMSFGGSGLLRRATSSDGRRPEQYYKSDAASFELPSLIEMGLAYKRDLTEDLFAVVTGSFVNDNMALDQYRIGGEVGYTMDKLRFFGRGGMEFSPKSDMDEVIWGPAVGAGLYYAAPGISFMLDYAYRQTEYFNDNSMFTLTFGF